MSHAMPPDSEVAGIVGRLVTPPLVIRLGASTWGWVQSGCLWLTSGGPWALVADYQPAPGIGGRVCTESEVAALVERVGRPTR